MSRYNKRKKKQKRKKKKKMKKKQVSQNTGVVRRAPKNKGENLAARDW